MASVWPHRRPPKLPLSTVQLLPCSLNALHIFTLLLNQHVRSQMLGKGLDPAVTTVVRDPDSWTVGSGVLDSPGEPRRSYMLLQTWARSLRQALAP